MSNYASESPSRISRNSWQRILSRLENISAAYGVTTNQSKRVYLVHKSQKLHTLVLEALERAYGPTLEDTAWNWDSWKDFD